MSASAAAASGDDGGSASPFSAFTAGLAGLFVAKACAGCRRAPKVTSLKTCTCCRREYCRTCVPLPHALPGGGEPRTVCEDCFLDLLDLRRDAAALSASSAGAGSASAAAAPSPSSSAMSTAAAPPAPSVKSTAAAAAAAPREELDAAPALPALTSSAPTDGTGRPALSIDAASAGETSAEAMPAAPDSPPVLAGRRLSEVIATVTAHAPPDEATALPKRAASDAKVFDYNRTKELAMLCAECYEREGAVKPEKHTSHKMIERVSSPTGTFAFIAANDDEIVVCFRGTCIVRNIATDLQTAMLPVPGVATAAQRLMEVVKERRWASAAAGPGSSTPTPTGAATPGDAGAGSSSSTDAGCGSPIAPAADTGMSVHEGFLAAYMSVRFQLLSAVRAALDSRKPKALTVTGHSLGAALATLAARDIADHLLSGPRAGTVYTRLVTFGSPRVASKPFTQRVEALVDEVWRVANAGDPVTVVPTYSFVLPYKHCGTLVRFRGEGETDFDVDPPRESVGKRWMEVATTGIDGHVKYLGARFPTNPFVLDNK